MAKYDNLSMCDIPWWDYLKTKEEKDKYCQEHFDMSFAEFWAEVEHQTVGYNPETQEFYAL